MWNSVKPNGHLLIIEPTELMNPQNAQKAINSGLPRKRRNGLKLWARARENNSVDPRIFENIKVETKHSVEYLDGLVKAWIFKKEQ
jgi:hypothetical protein